MDLLKKCLSGATFIFFSFSSLPVFSQQNGDAVVVSEDNAASDEKNVSLSAIDRLIKQDDYNQALKLCALYVQQNPDNFDAAKRRIDRIMSIRRKYNYVEGRLIDVAANEPAAAEKNYQLVLELEKIEKNPSALHETIRNEVKNLSQFKACQARFNEIIENARKDVADRKYVQAMDQFRNNPDGKQNAFEIYREDFHASQREMAVIDGAIDSIKSSMTEFASAQKEFTSACESFASACDKDNLPEMQTQCYNVLNKFNQLAAIRKNIQDNGSRLQSLFDSLNVNGDMTDASYLPFLITFVNGLKNDPSTGILGVVDSEYVFYADRLNSKIASAAKRSSVSLTGAFSSASLMNGAYGFDRTALYNFEKTVDVSRKIAGVYDLADFRTADRDRISELKTQTADADSLKAAVGILLDDGEVVKDLVVRSKTAGLPEDARATIRSRNVSGPELITFADRFVSEKKKILEEEKQFISRSNPYVDDSAVKLQTSIADSIKKRCDECLSEIWVSAADFYASGSDQIVSEDTTAFVKLNGFLPEKGAVDSSGNLLPQNPSQCLSDIPSFRTQIGNDLDALKKCLARLDTGKDLISLFSTQYEKISTNISVLQGMSSKVAELETKARAQQRIARSARTEAEAKYNEARQLLSKNNFQGARTALQAARSRYNESLEAQEDRNLRSLSDRNLSELGNTINETENAIVVREVRKYKDDAKTAYYNGNFEEAENLLSRAQSRWSVTNVDKDEEIESLKALVNTALSMKTGRVIPPTAPLYPEMSQILSLANQYYSQGQKLKQQGKDGEAAALLNQAKQKLNELKLVYPLNQEASILSLKIDQLMDRQAFNSMFASRVTAARNNSRSSDVKIKQQAYSDLVDLAEINPQYPGLKDLIYQMELDLGLRAKPVDNSSVVKAQQLANDAKRIYSQAGRDSAKLSQARNLALQASALDPNNRDAVLLLDQIALKTGGRAQVVLSSADEKLYQQAVQELQKNNIIAANTIVQRILSKPENQRCAKVLELKKKVEALL